MRGRENRLDSPSKSSYRSVKSCKFNFQGGLLKIQQILVGVVFGVGAALTLSSCVNTEDSESRHDDNYSQNLETNSRDDGDHLQFVDSNFPAPRAEGCLIGRDALEVLQRL